MNIVIFGLGLYYQENKQKFDELVDHNVIALADNNQKLWNTKIDGIPVYNPQEILQMPYDIIVVMSKAYFKEICMQLNEIGIKNDALMSFEQFWGFANKGKMQEYCSAIPEGEYKKKILFITVDLNYDGGTLAIIYAALLCKERGAFPIILARDGDLTFINEFREKGLNIWLYPNLPYASLEEMRWIKDFDKVVVNTFLMAHCVLEFKKQVPIIWWIHEVKRMYEESKGLCEQCIRDTLDNVEIYSVTNQAKNNLEEFVPNAKSDILLLGIPDILSDLKIVEKKKEKMVFAVIGLVSFRKAQDVFLNAAAQVEEQGYEDIEFWIIGNIIDDKYGKGILNQAGKLKNVKILGKRTREEMAVLYPEIDVVVVCSREETLSIVAIESMIYKKVCIVSDACGIADYVPASERHLVYQEAFLEQLVEKMKWCLEHRNELPQIGEEARKTYENVFSIEAFSSRLYQVLKI